jgi:DNA-directed RNA polymerase specialized sigma24 family protein
VVKEKRRYARRQKRDGRRNEALPTAGLPDRMVESVSRILDRIHLDEILARLPADDERVVRWHKQCGYTFGEIAAKLGLPGADAARKRCARALLRLADLLTPGVAAD